MGKSHNLLVRVSASVTLAAACFFAGRVWAGGPPLTGALTYSGLLEDAAGKPLTGEHPVQVNFWDSAQPGMTPLCQTPSKSQTLDAGRFAIALPDSCADAVKEKPDVWAEILVDGISLGSTKIGAVPYALEAGHAKVASGAVADLKRTLDGLAKPKTRVLYAPDNREGCPATAAVNADLVVLKFTLKAETSVFLAGQIIRQHMGRADVGLYVDDKQVMIGLSNSSTDDWYPSHVTWGGPLETGDHVVSLRATTTGVVNAWGCRGLHGGLTAILFE